MANDQEEQLTDEIKRKGFFGTLRDGLMSASSLFEDVLEKANNLTETNYRLACDLAQQGAVDDAIMRFRITLWLAPDHIPSLYNLGCLYHHKGQNSKALDCFTKVVRRVPNHHHALFMIASISPGLLKPEMRPRTLPPEIAIEFFDRSARTYEYNQQTRGYALPALVHQLLHVEFGRLGSQHDLIDLGCGTGLCGAQFREEFANIVGVDFSNGMLDEAYRKMDRRGVKIFTRLEHKDLRTHLFDEEKPNHFDVALLISVLPYLGDIERAFAGAARVLKAGGLFAVSFDPYAGAHQGFEILPRTGYFGHSLDYVLARAEANGLECLRTGEVRSYPQTQVQLCFFQKKA